MIRALVLLLALLPAAGLAEGCDRAVPIRFPPGASQGSIEGVVLRAERDCYSVTGRAGQTMRVTIRALEDNAVFQLYAPGWRLGRADYGVRVDGQTLRGAGEGEDATLWEGALPGSGAHLIVVGGTRGNATYGLTVTIR